MQSGFKALLLCSWAILVLFASATRADDFGPWSVEPAHPVFAADAPQAQPEPNTQNSSPFGLAFQVWSDLLTRLDGPRCSHRPTCGAFADQALRRYGLPLGAWLAFNRLTRGARSSMLRQLPLVPGAAGLYLLDSLEDNAFWRPGYLPISGR